MYEQNNTPSDEPTAQRQDAIDANDFVFAATGARVRRLTTPEGERWFVAADVAGRVRFRRGAGVRAAVAVPAETDVPEAAERGCGFGPFRTLSGFQSCGPLSDIPCTAGIVPSRPFWKSSKACCSSSRVFITKGP